MLILPVGINATKPLMLTHVAGMAYLDTSLRILENISNTTFWFNRTPWDLAIQNIRFWTYLELIHPEYDFAESSEYEIGELYVECFQSQVGIDSMIDQFRKKSQEITNRVEHKGYVHPSSLTIYKWWKTHLEFLGIGNLKVDNQVKLTLSQDQVLDQLAQNKLLLDQRAISGSVFLDLTSFGLSLRTLISENGSINYLLPVLRDIYRRAEQSDGVVLYYDDSVRRDYIYIDKILSLQGIKVIRKELFRIAVGGTLYSSKGGGWSESTFAFFRRQYLDELPEKVARLAVKSYLLFFLNQKGKESFSGEGLCQSIEQAKDLLETVDLADTLLPDDERMLYSKMMKANGLVNIFQLFTSIYQKRSNNQQRASLLKLVL